MSSTELGKNAFILLNNKFIIFFPMIFFGQLYVSLVWYGMVWFVC